MLLTDLPDIVLKTFAVSLWAQDRNRIPIQIMGSIKSLDEDSVIIPSNLYTTVTLNFYGQLILTMNSPLQPRIFDDAFKEQQRKLEIVIKEVFHIQHSMNVRSHLSPTFKILKISLTGESRMSFTNSFPRRNRSVVFHTYRRSHFSLTNHTKSSTRIFNDHQMYPYFQ